DAEACDCSHRRGQGRECRRPRRRPTAHGDRMSRLALVVAAIFAVTSATPSLAQVKRPTRELPADKDDEDDDDDDKPIKKSPPVIKRPADRTPKVAPKVPTKKDQITQPKRPPIKNDRVKQPPRQVD